MNHEMKLNPEAFLGVKEGKQKWETRLADGKRKNIVVGDTITFSKLPELVETITVKVTQIIGAKNFEELFTKFDPLEANWPEDYSPTDCANAMQEYYSVDEQNENGVLAFRIYILN